MGSSLGVFANIVQILGFVLQLVQAGPDLMGRIPGIVRGARAWLRGMTSMLGIIVQAWYRADRIVAGLHDDARALEEGRVGVE
jgi:hypothetical protein